MSKGLTDTGMHRAIQRLEPVQIVALHKQAANRLKEQLDTLLAADDFNGARALIERMHLLTGNRRVKHVNPRECALLRRQAD